jgi:hypothetical protein
MKKLNLIIAILILNIATQAQGWVGNTTNNSIVSYNSNLQLTPLNVGIGTSILNRNFEVNGTSRIGTFAPNLGSILDIAGGTNNQINITHNSTWGLIVGYSGSQAYAGHPYTGTNAAALINFQNGPMYLGTSNTSRLTILGNGNVGIGTFGTLQPTALFHTLGTLRFQNLVNNNYTRVLVQDIDGNVSYREDSTFGVKGNFWNILGNTNTNPTINFLGTTDNQRLVFRTNNIEKMTVLPNGNVGIGTNAPFVQLSNSTTHIGNNAGFGTTVASGLDWVNNNQGYVASFYNSDANDAERNGVLIKTLNTGSGSKVLTVNSGAAVGGTDLFTVLGNGNVGVGTNSPQNNFHVVGGANIESMPMKQVGDNLVFQDGSGSGELRTLTPGAPNTFLSGDGTWQPVNAGTTTNSLVFINPSIITSTVNGVSSSITIPVNSSNTINSCGAINMVPRLTGVNTYGCSQIFDNGTTGVGIGSTGPFTYTTSAWRSTGAAATGTLRLRVAGNVQGTHFIATSDKTLKTDIKSIENASDLINKIEGKTYAWKVEYQKESGVDNGRHYGFLAQDIEKVLPEAVIKDEKGRYAVEYNAVIPVLVESQKEIIKENESLKSDIASLKSENEMMKEKFALLEKSILALCENGCGGLKDIGAKTSSEVDVLFQSIPNPTDDIAIINYSLVREYADATLVINTQDGKQIKAYKLESKLGAGSVKVSLGELSSGTYLYTLTAGGHVVDTKRLQIVK